MKRNIPAVLFVAALVALRYILVSRADFSANPALYLHIAAAAFLCAGYFLLRYLRRKKPGFFDRLKEKLQRYI
ncbi:MAG: hypothetical protein IJL26_00700 [Clostridia bacterium]|nr:hypothetical protein [Clostridia bacterium]